MGGVSTVYKKEGHKTNSQLNGIKASTTWLTISPNTIRLCVIVSNTTIMSWKASSKVFFFLEKWHKNQDDIFQYTKYVNEYPMMTIVISLTNLWSYSILLHFEVNYNRTVSVCWWTSTLCCNQSHMYTHKHK